MAVDNCACPTCMFEAAPDSGEAEQRARSLLNSLLTESQRAELREHSKITMHPPEAGRATYEIGMGPGRFYVWRRQAGRVTRMCVSPDRANVMPRSDWLLTLFLWIMGDYPAFVQKANAVGSWADDD